MQGPGLTVRLNDAPADSPRRDDVSPDDLVVHQQDIQAVMNALWAGGAEAMELMDQRVISTSAIHCAGNVLRLHGRIYSPPYDIRAVGDPDRLRRALDVVARGAVLRPGRRRRRAWAGRSPTRSAPSQLSAYSGPTDLEAAEVPEGTEILPGLDDAEAREPRAVEPHRATGAPGPRERAVSRASARAVFGTIGVIGEILITARRAAVRVPGLAAVVDGRRRQPRAGRDRAPSCPFEPVPTPTPTAGHRAGR